MVLTDIGEIGVNWDGQRFILRPSLFAMTQLGSPEEIVRVYASVMHEETHADQLEDALAVIYACSDDRDAELLSKVFGSLVKAVRGAGWRYKQGAAPMTDVLPLARCLMRHGVVGDYDPLPVPANKDKEYTTEFKARDHVSLAVAHLGVTSKEAWNMTMTEIVGGLRAKFPEAEAHAKAEAAKYPSDDDMKFLMDYHNSIGGR